MTIKATSVSVTTKKAASIQPRNMTWRQRSAYLKYTSNDDGEVVPDVGNRHPMTLEGIRGGTECDDNNMNDQELLNLNELILDMCKPLLEHTGKIVNIDNYYMSPMVLAQMKMRGIFGRGTMRMN